MRPEQGSHRTDVVRFWRSVELFSPPQVAAPKPAARRYAWRPGAPLPWEPGHPLERHRRPPRRRWQHRVYVGIFSLDAMRAIVEDQLGRDPDSYDERDGGESALAAFLVSETGQLVADSAVLSSAAWATGRVAKDGELGALDGFAGAQAAFRRQVEELAESDPLDAARIVACLAAAAATTATAGILHADAIRTATNPTSDRAADRADEHDFLNSFIHEDLDVVATASARGDVGAGFDRYMNDSAAAAGRERIDVRVALGEVADAVAPERVPPGRWPAAPDRPAALGQQLAAAEALRQSAGVLGINGPPGTGKTTMLRDVIANVVVARALRLAELAHPRDAFAGKAYWRVDAFEHRVPRWRPELTGFEIVVASANNGAVENVTRDIPAVTAIDRAWHADAEELDYFREIASALGDHPRDAWALVAAELGRAERRMAFVNDALWGGDGEDDRPLGLLRLLLAMKDEIPPAQHWDAAVAAFGDAVARAEALRAERARFAADLARWEPLRRAVDDARRRVAAAERDQAEAQARQTEAEAASRTADAEAARWLAAWTRHKDTKPGLVERLRSLWGVMRPWRERARALAERVDAAEHGAAERSAEQAAARTALAHATRQLGAARAEAARAERELARVSGALRAARDALGDRFPGPDWWTDEGRDRRERTAPWTDPAWDAARTRVFLAALGLHKAFVRQAPRELRAGLSAAASILEGSAPRDLPESDALAAWHALFFVVPVVSTTFASFARMFSHLGRESLGWLLIDEAGQASPQSAAGAVWRARRSLIVGDPLQLEPIRSLSFRVEQSLARQHGVAPEWSPTALSAQQLADRASTYGTWLGDDGALWVGSPLTVHRRCDEPMFGAVNAIAYDGLMTFATDPAAGAAFDARYGGLPPSKWIDVPGDEADGHWIPAQGRQLDEILRTLQTRGVPMQAVMAIGPFRDVARQLQARTTTFRGLRAGTVHTAQGKEADVVILVLGGDPARAGARRWAAQRPNLLNVAVSRARRRLYVIGDYAAWSPERHFDVLARHVDRHDPVRRAAG